MVSTRLLPRSERLGGRSLDGTARSRHRITASLRRHTSRSTAYLTTLQEPCPSPGTSEPSANHARGRYDRVATGSEADLLSAVLGTVTGRCGRQPGRHGPGADG